MISDRYDVGDVVRLTAHFTSRGTDVDPDKVVFKALPPGGEPLVWTYGEDAEVIRLGTGHYYLDLPLTAGGAWHYRVEGLGAYQCADEQQFVVRETVFGEGNGA